MWTLFRRTYSWSCRIWKFVYPNHRTESRKLSFFLIWMRRAISKTNVCERREFSLFLSFLCFLYAGKIKVSRDLCRQKKSCHEQKENETFLTEQILIRHLVLEFLLLPFRNWENLVVLPPPPSFHTYQLEAIDFLESFVSSFRLSGICFREGRKELPLV